MYVIFLVFPQTDYGMTVQHVSGCHQVCGTIGYTMPPEMLLGPYSMPRMCDLYAVGVTMCYAAQLK